MISKTLTLEEIEELRVELRGRLPGTAKIYYVIQSFLDGLLPGKEVIVDSWPQWSSIVVRTFCEEKAQPFFRYTYMCHARSTSALKYFLQRPDVVNWRKPATFTGVPRDIAPVIQAMCHKHMGQLSSLEPRFMYAWTRQDLPAEPVVPDGLLLGKLEPDDAVILRQDWEGCRYRDDLEGYFRTVIEHYESSCLRDTNGELLAYACMQFNGSIAMLYVKPEHRDKDYFKIVLTDLARTRLKTGDVAYGFIPTNDSNLVDQMRSMDFVWVPRGDMVWMTYEPLKINRSNSPNALKTNQTNDTHDQAKSLDCVCSPMAKFSKEFDSCRYEIHTDVSKTTNSTSHTESDISSLVSQTS